MLWRPLQGDLPTCPALALVHLGRQCRQQNASLYCILCCFFMVFKCVSHFSLYVDVEEGGGEQASLALSNCGSEPFSYVVVMVDYAGRHVVEAFSGSDEVVIDDIQPHGCLQSCMPNSVERLLEFYKDPVKVLLV